MNLQIPNPSTPGTVLRFATDTARQLWNRKLDSIDQYQQAGYQDLQTSEVPYNARPLVRQANPYPAWPAPGGQVTVITYTVPPGFNSVIDKLAINNIGGGFVDGTGQIFFRVLRNGYGVQDGLENLTGQIGQIQLLQPISPIILVENDVLTIIAGIPAGQPAQGGTIGAMFTGFEVPVVAGGLQ